MAFGNRKVECFSINNTIASERHADAYKTTNTPEVRTDIIFINMYYSRQTFSIVITFVIGSWSSSQHGAQANII